MKSQKAWRAVVARRNAASRKSYLRELLGLSALVSVGHAAHAAPVLPQGGQFVAGAGVISQPGMDRLQVDQQSLRGIIDWRSFSIGQGGSVAINNGQGATLNRVTGGQLSEIQGRLSATGSVYLVNPQGVVIGPGGKVIGGGSVVVSTRNIADGAFMAGGVLAASGTSPGDVANFGRIISKQGDVLLIGRSVDNAGAIKAANGSVILAAADSVLMTAASGVSGVYVVPDSAATGDVTEEGRIQAAAAALTAAGGNVYTLAGNRKDLIEAQGVGSIGGQVWLTAPNGQVSVAGDVVARNADGAGGTIVARGRSTQLDGSLDASGLSGGKVFVGVTGPQVELSDSTTVADGASIKVGGPQGGGEIETSGHLLAIGRAAVDTAGGRWLLDPINLTIDSASGAVSTIVNALNSSDVTIQTNASGVSNTGIGDGIGVQTAGAGDITVASPISWSSNHSLTLQAFHDLNVGAAITNTAAGGLTLTAGGAIGIGAAVSADTVSLIANGGNLTLNSGASVTGTAATGLAVTLQTTGRFINGGAVSVGGGANWRLYSTDPTQDALGGLSPDFFQYNAGFGATPAAPGNGALYSIAPSASYSLIGGVSKVYDGAAALAAGSLTAANLSASGLLSGDTAAPTDGSGTLSQSDVGTSLLATLTGGVSITRGGKPVYGYGLSGSIQGVIGSITQRPLTVDIVDGPNGVTKIYDGNDTALLNQGNFLVLGIAPGDTGTVLISPGPKSAIYVGTDGLGHAPPNVGAGYGLTVDLISTNFVSTGSIKLTNYLLPDRPQNDSRAIGPITSYANARITPAPLQLLGLTAVGKSYDSTATASVTATGLSGVINSDNVSLGGITATFDNGGDAASGVPVTYQVALAGDADKIRNYQVVLPSLTANISKAALTLNGLSVLNGGKVYDGTLAALIDTSLGELDLSQIFVSDRGSMGFDASHLTALYAQADVGQGIAVTVDPGSIALTGRGVNYALSVPTLFGKITPRQLTVHLGASAAGKIYDGNAIASVDPAKFSITGWAAGEGADVSIFQTASAFFTQGGVNQSNAGTYDVTAKVTVSDFKVTGSTRLSNYYTTLDGGGAPTLSATVLSAGGGLISPAPLDIRLVGNPTKTYDGTTDITLASGNFQISGFVNGESATVKDGLTGAFASPNAAPAIALSIDLNNPGSFDAAAGTLMSNYVFSNPVQGFGTINPKSLAGSIDASLGGTLTKIYDGTQNILLAPANFVLTGWENGDGADVLVTQTAGLFASKDAGEQTVYAILQNDSGRAGTASLRGDFTSSSTNLLNYTLPEFASGTGRIDPRALTISITGSPTKVYNGTLNAPLLSGADYRVLDAASGLALDLVTGETITVNQPSAFYADKNVGARAVSATIDANNLSISGGLLSNYTLGAQGTQTLSGTATGAGVINYAQLTILSVGADNKVYDGATGATIDFSNDDTNLFGVVAGEDVHLDANPGTGTFATFHAGSGIAITPTLAFGIHGADTGNYQLTAPTLRADITPKHLAVTGVTAQNKVYDSTLNATLDNTGAQLQGVVGGDPVGLTLSTTGTFASRHVGNSIAVAASGYGLNFSDPAFSGDYVLDQPGGLAADISPAQLFGSIINNPTKTYDGSTTVNLTGGMGGSSSFQITGWQGSDGAGATIDHAAVAAYLSKDAGDQTVDATLLPSSFVGVSNLYDYYLPFVSGGSPSQSVGHIQGLGHIDKAPLVAQIVGNPTKVYNADFNFDAASTNTSAGNSAGLIASNYLLLGFATGEGSDVSVSQTVGAFDVKDVGIRLLTAALANGRTDAHHYGDYSSTVTNLDNYLLPNLATGAATITPFHITVGGITANDKTYNRNGTFTLNNGGAALVNVFAADSGRVALGAKATTGSSIDGVDVGLHQVSINAGAYSLTGAAASDYVIDSVNTPTASITPASLTLRVVKTYDGSDDAGMTDTGNLYSLLGVLGGDDVGLGANTFAGTYSSAHVGGVQADPTVSLSSGGVNLTGAKAMDYLITGATGVINPLHLQVQGAVAQDKIYDGGTSALISNTSTQLIGVLGPDQATIQLLSDAGDGNGAQVLTPSSITAGVFASPDVRYDGGHNVITVGVSTAGYSLGGNTNQDYLLDQPTGLAAKINPSTLLVVPNGVTKAYDGTGVLPTNNLSYSLANLLSQDLGHVFVDASLVSGSYDGIGGLYNVGTNLAVHLADLALTGDRSGNYQIAPVFVGNIGTITKATLTASILTQTKVYDGTVTAANLLGQYVITGVHGEKATVGVTTGAYDSASVVGAGTVTVSGLTAGDFSDAGSTGGTAFLTSNYDLPTSISGSGSITRASLTASLNAQTKAYDGTTTAGGLLGQYVITGVHGEKATVGKAAGAYDDANVLGATTVTVGSLVAGDFSDGGSTGGSTFLASNYFLPTSISGSGSITQASLTASIAAQTKVYDGTTTAAGLLGQYLITGVHGEKATVDVATGAYDDANVLGAATVTVDGLVAGNFSDGGSTGGTTFRTSNYVLPTSISGSGSITRASLIASILAQTKVYDGTTAAGGLLGQYVITGVHGEKATVGKSAGAYDSANVVGASTVTVSGLAAGDFSDAGSTGGTTFLTSNYVLPTSISGSGSITRASLTASLNAQAKVYDGTVTAANLLGQYVITGVHGERGTVTVATGAYDDANVLGATTVTVSGLVAGDFADGGSTGGTTFLAGNYVLPTSISGAGSITPASLTAAIAAQTKVYDGTTAASGLLGQYVITGVHGERAAIGIATGAYDDPNVLGAGTVTVGGLVAGDFSDGGSTGGTSFLASNYVLPTSISGPGSITPRALTASFADTSKVYDQTLTTALLTGFALHGFIAGQGGSIGDAPATGLYGVKDVTASPQTITVSLAGASFAAAGSTSLSNYSLPTTATGLGAITPALLSVTNLGVKDKVYDGTTAAELDLSNVTAGSLTGVIAGDDVTLSSLPGGAAFVSPNAGENIAIVLTGQAISGADAGDYILSSSALPKADIRPRPLTAAIIGTPTKVYDGGALALLTSANFQLSNFVSGEGAAVTRTTGTYAAADAGQRTVTTSLSGGDFTANAGTMLSNYVLPTSASGAGLITPRPLTATIVGEPSKYFDASDEADLTADNFLLSGFVGGQGASIGVTRGVYSGLGPSAGLTVSAQLAAGDFTAAGGTNLANYILPTTATGPGAIRPPLSSDLFARFENQLAASGVQLTPEARSIMSAVVFAVATPRVYIPFPAPGALSTWKGNGFGSLPIVVNQGSEYATAVSADGSVAVQSGAPMINNTEQVLLQGVRSKQYHITIPPRTDVGPELAAQ